MAAISGLIRVMERAARKAGGRLRRDFGEVAHLQVSRKGPSDFVSKADQASERTLWDELRAARPDWGFVLEEGGTIEGDPEKPRWIIDPLDGTSNFLHGIPHFAISIAVQEPKLGGGGWGDVVAGLVYQPITDESFWAEKARGAWLQDARLRVSSRRQLGEALIATGIPYHAHGDFAEWTRVFSAVGPQVAGIRRFGSAALDLAWVAAGRFDGFWESHLQSWDTAAGCLLVREAGGFVNEAGFQLKNGASFARGEQYTEFDFSDKHSAGWGTTYEVERARFDQLLAREAGRQGAEVHHGHEVVAVDVSGPRPRATVKDPMGCEYLVEAGFILDASGFGRVLPRLLQLETPSKFPVRASIFTHVEDGIISSEFDRNKIRITVHPVNHEVWYWLIPFATGRSSIGVVAEASFLARYAGDETERLATLVGEDPSLSRLLRNATWDTPGRQIVGYSANVKSLCGPGFALLGNAGEFLDPIFSSGVTIAFKSASLAANVLRRQFAGETVDWQNEFATPLKRGVDTFRAFVESWYRGGFQRIVFRSDPPREVRRMVSAILAGYAWDQTNPYVRDTARRLAALEELCYER